MSFAIKIEKEGAPDDATQRFENEAKALEEIDCTGFPTLIENGRLENGRSYIVMTLATGKTIKKIISDNVADKRLMGVTTALAITKSMLESLHCLHEIPLLHRDIKPANVIVSDDYTKVTIIDLGQCKGTILPHRDLTFWQIGASRYSPPAKLENPGHSTQSHDLFAVGVILYKLLTNISPWTNAVDGDVGDLKRKMENDTVHTASETNPQVSSRIDSLVKSMMTTEDYKRISLDDALAEIELIEISSDESSGEELSAAAQIKFDKVIRDPLHGDVRMTRFEFSILNTPQFQRLRRIRQLGTTHLVYPGAEHSRFSHAIGTLFVTEKILRSIEIREGTRFTAIDRLAARLYALLHDLTHAPFGHTLEDELGFFDRHDKNRLRLLRSLKWGENDLAAVLRKTNFGIVVLDLLLDQSSDRWKWIPDLIGNSVGADVLDYIDRDSYFCGLDHRIDSVIFRYYSVANIGKPTRQVKRFAPRVYGSYGVRVDAEHALVSVLRERYALFLKIYTYSAKLSSGAMLGKALYAAMKVAPEQFDETAVERMGDDELLNKLIESGGEAAARLTRKYTNRQLYKPIFRSRPFLEKDGKNGGSYNTMIEKFKNLGLFTPSLRDGLEHEFASEAGVDQESIILYCSRSAPGAKLVNQWVEQSPGTQLEKSATDSVHQEIFAAHLNLWNLFLFVDDHIPFVKKQLLAHLLIERFGYKNEVEIDRKQLSLI